MKKILTILFILTISTQFLNAQNIKRANRLFEKTAYLNAAEIYLKEDIKSQEVLEKLGDCYYFNADMINAFKWYKVLMDEHYKNNTVDLTYTFRYAQTLKGINNFDEADKWYKLYSESEPLTSNSNIKTVDFFKSLNQSIDRPYIIHKVSINSANSDFGVFVKEKKVLFASNQTGEEIYDWNNQPYLDLYEASIDKNGDLINVTPLNSNINTKMHESNAIITKDGQTMYFTRNNYNNGKKVRDKNKVTQLKIYKAQLINGEWGNVTELPFNNDNYSTMHPALNTDETKLYFSSDRPGTIGSFDIFVVDVNPNGTYGTPKNLGDKINTKHREQFPFISIKNNLYFASDGHFGLGGLDIFKSTISDKSYGSPQNLSDKINSNHDDFSFSIDENKEIGYFSSNRLGGKGDDDIYRFTQLKIFYITGIAQNKNTLEILPGTLITLMDNSGTKISKMTVGIDASFNLEIKPNKRYTIKGSLKLFNSSEISFSTDNKGNINKNILLMLESYQDLEEKIVVENKKIQIKINPIYFNFDKWDIKDDAANELDNVVAIMKKYPSMIIEIGAHTDVRGSDHYNMILSHKRAKSVREYLVKNGISDKNVQSKGYGETQPLNHCVKEGICKEKEYNINRRCEFVILN